MQIGRAMPAKRNVKSKTDCLVPIKMLLCKASVHEGRSRGPHEIQQRSSPPMICRPIDVGHLYGRNRHLLAWSMSPEPSIEDTVHVDCIWKGCKEMARDIGALLDDRKGCRA